MTTCLVCERHALYRIVLRFTKEAVIAQRHVAVLEKFRDTHSAHVRWETPELTKRGMKGGVAIIIVDRLLPNLQKKTLMAFADGFKGEINADDLDEGFISIFREDEVVELLNYEYCDVSYGGKRSGRTKGKK